MAQNGAGVAVNYNSGADRAESLVAEIRQEGGNAKAYRANIADAAQVQAMTQAIENELGPVSILVNNAGITRDRSFRKMTRTEWDEVLAVDLGGPFNVSAAVLPRMIDSGWGRIVSISSIIGQMGGFGQSNYAAAKAGLIGWTKALARETAGKGVTVNVVAPGFVETDMTAGIPEKVRAKITESIPIGRFGKTEEIAPAVVFLALPQSSFITGQVLAVNGGQYM
jgi:NAD(P)-dependent dehydrogenase (short-subunit alcohol dehydrogenase family)